MSYSHIVRGLHLLRMEEHHLVYSYYGRSHIIRGLHFIKEGGTSFGLSLLGKELYHFWFILVMEGVISFVSRRTGVAGRVKRVSFLRRD